MSLKIKSVEKGSLAADHGLQAGDRILTLNGIKIRDFLDLELYASDFKLEFLVENEDGCPREIMIFRESARALGIIPQDYRHKNCQNNCVFCFIDQMPPKLRKTLYAKDDDYLFSYVFGNYITLTNMKQEELDRIVEQRISPLYISLHSSNPDLRQKMMRSARPVDAMAILRFLAEQEIEFHIQIVLVPGYNDKEELRWTLTDLMDTSLNILSIGIVPVGLTDYRDALCQLKPVDRSLAQETLDLATELRATFESTIIYPADEFFVLAGRELPEEDFYGDYPQLENGIGMLRLGYSTFKKKKRALLKELRKIGGDFLLLGSASARDNLMKITSELNQRLKGQTISLQVVRNDFFGEHITVAGLITYADLVQQCESEKGQTLIIPDVIFNEDGLSLDGKSIEDLKLALKRDILLVDQLFSEWILVD